MMKVRRLKKREFVKIIRKFERAIKNNCYDCMGGQKKLDCDLETCSLYPFRPWVKKDNRTDFKKDK